MPGLTLENGIHSKRYHTYDLNYLQIESIKNQNQMKYDGTRFNSHLRSIVTTVLRAQPSDIIGAMAVKRLSIAGVPQVCRGKVLGCRGKFKFLLSNFIANFIFFNLQFSIFKLFQKPNL